MQPICTLLQTDNHTNTSSINFFLKKVVQWNQMKSGLENSQYLDENCVLVWMLRFVSFHTFCIIWQFSEVIISFDCVDFVLKLLLQMAAFGKMRTCPPCRHLHVLTLSWLDQDFLHNKHLPRSIRFVEPNGELCKLSADQQLDVKHPFNTPV